MSSPGAGRRVRVPISRESSGGHAGKIANFPYSNGLRTATFDWTPEKLDQWIADPQSLIQDSYMMYKQADPAIRTAIIGYLATLKAQ
jgi:cytochrome c